MEDESQSAIQKISGSTKPKPKKKGKGKTDKRYQNIQNFFEAQLDLQGQQSIVQAEMPKKITVLKVDTHQLEPQQKVEVIQPIKPIEVQVEHKEQILIVLPTCKLNNELIIEAPKITEQSQHNQKLQKVEVVVPKAQQHNQQEIFDFSSSIITLATKTKNKKQAKGSKNKKKQLKVQQQTNFECNIELQEEKEEKTIQITPPPSTSIEVSQVQQEVKTEEVVEPEPIKSQPIQVSSQIKVSEQFQAQPQPQRQVQLQFHKQPQPSQKTPLPQQKTSLVEEKSVEVIIPQKQIQQNAQQQQLVLLQPIQVSVSKPKTKKQSKTKTKKKEVKKQVLFQINLEEQLEDDKIIIPEDTLQQQIIHNQQIKDQSKAIEKGTIEPIIQPVHEEPSKVQQTIKQDYSLQPKIQQDMIQQSSIQIQQSPKVEQPVAEVKQIIKDTKQNELIEAEQQSSIIAVQSIQAPKSIKPKTKKQSKQKSKKKQTKNTFTFETNLEQQTQQIENVSQDIRDQEVILPQNNLDSHIEQQSNLQQQAIIEVAEIEQPKIVSQQPPKQQILWPQYKLEPVMQYVHKEEDQKQEKIGQIIEQEQSQIAKEILNNKNQPIIEQEILDIVANIQPVVINKTKSKKSANTKTKKKQTKVQKKIQMNFEEQIQIKQQENIQKIVKQEVIQNPKIEEEKIQARYSIPQKAQYLQLQEFIKPIQAKQQVKQEIIEPIVYKQPQKAVQTVPLPIVTENKQDAVVPSQINIQQQIQSEVVDLSVNLNATSKKKTKKQSKGKGQKKQAKKIMNVQQDFLVVPQSESIQTAIKQQSLPISNQNNLISISNEIDSFKEPENPIINESPYKQHHQERTITNVIPVIQRWETLKNSKHVESDSSKVISELISLIRFHNDSELRTIRDRMQMLEQDILSRKLRSLEQPRVSSKKTDYQWIVEENINLKRQYETLNQS